MSFQATPARPKIARAEAALAKHALAYPEVLENRPWGHRAFKVKGKTFVFLTANAEGLSLSVKLPTSRYTALELPFTEPTHYGLGKSGWVTANFASDAAPPIEQLRAWIDESYRAIAPKKLLGATTLPAETAKTAKTARRAKTAAPARQEKRRATKRRSG